MHMAADFLQKQPARGPGRPFEKVRSGNPAGRRPGSRNKATLAAELVFDGEAEALSRKAIELALGGSEGALRLCLDRIIAPRRERPVQLAVPPIDSLPTGQARGLKAHDIAGAMAIILAAATQGIVTPDEAFKLGQLVDTFLRAIETSEFDRRLRLLEDPDPTDP
jgi:hypothetical protein